MQIPIYERCRIYIGERTGLPSHVIEMVLSASQDFWVQEHPELANAAADLLRQADEREGPER
jgi:hypothetical protein